MDEQDKETMEEFRGSFNYGSRNDLLFKFLGSRGITDQDAGEFFRGLLEHLGNAFDSGDYDKVMEHCFQWQVHGYTPQEGAKPTFEYDSTPWTPLTKPLSECRLALISAGGLFVDGDDPMGENGPTQEEAILRIGEFLRELPVLSAIPRDIERENLRVRHPGYDIRGTLADYNVVFPIDRLKEFEAEGVLGELAEENYSFVGASSQKRLLAEAAPEWAKQLNEKHIDAVMLVGA
ncbi:MAG: hypothetical protein IIC84_04635 [Chloroflexi bacterium]|nr:hypothetical protein [Chloroflexota bacterium]